MYFIGGQLPLNIYAICRVMFQTREEAETVLNSTLSKFTFLSVHPLSEIFEIGEGDDKLFFPTIPIILTGDPK